MVPRFRSMALRPIHRIKHVVDTQRGMTVGTVENVILIKTVDAPVLANVEEVETGSKVNGIYIKVEAVATSSAVLPNFYMIIGKNPGNNLTLPVPNAVGANDNKRFVFHQEMVMFQKQSGSNPRTVFNEVVVIPRGFRRMGPNDEIEMRFLSPGVTVDLCVQAHYKEFR